MDVRSGYKQTEVGVIPEEWDVRTIGEMFRLINGCAFKPEDWKSSGTPIIRIQNLNDPVAEFNFSQAPVLERNRIESGDLLFAWSGTLGSSFGARVWNGPSGVLNQHIFKVLMDEQQIALPFSLLVFARVEQDIAKQAHGFKASFVHVKKSDLVKVGLPLPPMPEQRAIAAALSDVDALLSGLDRLIAKKRDLKQAAMQQLLTGQTRLPGFHGEWDAVEFGEIASIRNAKVVASSMPAGTQCVELESIGQGSGRLLAATEAAGMSSKYCFKKGDVLFGRLRAYLRKYWLATFDGVCSTEIWPLIPRDERLTGHFLHLLVQACDFVNAAGVAYGTHMPRSDWSVLKGFPVTLPPVSEQTAIAAVLSDMDAELAALEARRAKTRDLKQAMTQELLTGRTRLV